MAYLSGNILKFVVEFNDSGTNALVDPTTVEFHYQVNGGAWSSTLTYAGASTPALNVIARDSAGLYEVWIDSTSLSGVVTGQWVSLGTGAATADDTLTVGQTPGTGNTFFDLIEKVYRRVMAAQREISVQTSAAISSSATSFAPTGPQKTSIFPGCRLAIEMEVMYCPAWDGTTATVIRGWEGSSKSAHATGIICYVNPKYTRFDIGVAINDDLRSLSSPTNGLFRVNTTPITYSSVYQGYDLGALPSNYIKILGVAYREADPARRFPLITNFDERQFGSQNTDAAFPSGQALIIYEEAYPGLPMYVTYAAPFLKLVNPSDSLFLTPSVNDEAPPNIAYTAAVLPNLSPTMVDIPELGAEIYLTQVREIARNFVESQPDHRNAQDVPAQAIASSVNPLIMRRDRRISEEADRLFLKYPDRRR